MSCFPDFDSVSIEAFGFSKHGQIIIFKRHKLEQVSGIVLQHSMALLKDSLNISLSKKIQKLYIRNSSPKKRKRNSVITPRGASPGSHSKKIQILMLCSY